LEKELEDKNNCYQELEEENHKLHDNYLQLQ